MLAAAAAAAAACSLLIARRREIRQASRAQLSQQATPAYSVLFPESSRANPLRIEWKK